MDAKTQKPSRRAPPSWAQLDLAAAEGPSPSRCRPWLTASACPKRRFARAGSREALQKAVIEEFGRRFIADVFVPAMQLPKVRCGSMRSCGAGLWRTRDVEAHTAARTLQAPSELTTARASCATCCWRDYALARVLRRTAAEAVEARHLAPTPTPTSWLANPSALIMGLLHDTPLPARSARRIAPRRRGTAWSRAACPEPPEGPDGHGALAFLIPMFRAINRGRKVFIMTPVPPLKPPRPSYQASPGGAACSCVALAPQRLWSALAVRAAFRLFQHAVAALVVEPARRVGSPRWRTESRLPGG